MKDLKEYAPWIIGVAGVLVLVLFHKSSTAAANTAAAAATSTPAQSTGLAGSDVATADLGVILQAIQNMQPASAPAALGSPNSSTPSGTSTAFTPYTPAPPISPVYAPALTVTPAPGTTSAP